jgi:hypothetical protein
MRYEAYTSLSSWTRNNSLIIIGDLFFSPKKDIDYLTKIVRILGEFKPPSGIRRYSLYVMSKASAQGYR